jgi:pimeloyl-ACP methyl ester carboxylesterase
MQVLLIHGMGRTAWSMMRLRRWLTRSGHQVTSLGYVAAIDSVARIVERLRRGLQESAARGSYILIGHSLGGLLARMALSHEEVPALPAHLIMLGTPNQPPRLARQFRSFWPYRLINGDSGQLLAHADRFPALPAPSWPYTIVAGSAGPRGRWSPFGDEPNDGLVAVRETLIAPEDEPVVLPVRHTFMMNDARVRAVIAQVLARPRPDRGRLVIRGLPGQSSE